MPVKEFRIAPEPDTVIVLRSLCVHFAPWKEVMEEATPKKKFQKEQTKVKNAGDRSPFDGWGVAWSSEISKNKVDTPSLQSKEGENKNKVSAVPEEDEQQEPEEAARYYVSSAHLIQASPWFRRSLTKDKWNESERDVKDGLLHVSAYDWDIYAFLTVMNIFHLKNRDVGRKANIDRVAQIAVIVDYYECTEAVELFSDMWIEHLTKTAPVPSMYCRQLVLWIWISWVFGRIQEFNSATLVAIKECSEPIRTLGLPIPDRVSENVNIRRYESMEHIIAGLHSLRDKYERLDYKCPLNRDSFECGSLLYGAITKEMLAIKLISPRPEIPFADMNLKKLCADVRKMKHPNWQQCNNNYGYYGSNLVNCNLTKTVTAIVDNVDSTVSGLNLLSLKRALE